MVDPGLAAHGGVDLSQEGRRDLDEPYPPLVAGRRETGHIPDDPPTKGNKGAVAAEAVREQGIEDPVPDLQGLVYLPVREYDLLDLQAGQGAAHSADVEGGDGLVADDQDLGAAEVRGVTGRVGDEPAADQDGVGALAQGKVQTHDLACRAHKASASKRRRISFTTEAVPRFSVETTMSAICR
jgi:hypothetical protein